MARVTLEKLVKEFPDKSGRVVRAVNGIDLTIADGEFMVLVGPSGCGKSTTLRMIAGLETISDGVIRIDDGVVNGVLPKDRDIAMVFQNYALYPHMSVYDNLAFGLQQRRFPKDEIDARVREAALLLELDALLDRRPKALSGGQRQRVALGRAIVRKPKVFLFDEPLSNLDAKMRVSMRAEIAKLHARLGTTMIYVTHDQVEAMTLGQRICVMKDGAIMQVATPLALYNRPANIFVGGFIGSPPMNFISGRVQSSAGRTEFVARPLAAAAPLVLSWPAINAAAVPALTDREVLLGFRPEQVSVASPATTDRLPVIDATIDVVEPLGAETYLHLAARGHAFVGRVKPADSYRAGQHIQVVIDLAAAQCFDGKTGQVV